MLITKLVSSDLERNSEGTNFVRVFSGKTETKPFEKLYPSQGVVVEVCSEGLFFSSGLIDFTQEENFYWRLLTNNKRIVSKMFHSTSLLDLALLKNFTELYDPFGKRALIKLGKPELLCEIDLTKNIKVSFSADQHLFEVFVKDITVYKIHYNDSVVYFLPSNSSTLDSILERGTVIQCAIEDLTWLIPVLQKENIPLKFRPKDPVLEQVEPKVKVLFDRLKIDRNYVVAAGKISFEYPKSSKTKIFLRSIQTENRLVQDLVNLGFAVDNNQISCSNELAVRLICSTGDIIRTTGSINSYNLRVEFSENFKHDKVVKQVSIEAVKIGDQIIVKTNLDVDEFRVLMESLHNELYDERHWLSFKDSIILLPFGSLKSFRVFLEYFELSPDYKTRSFTSKDLSEIQIISFWSFATKLEHFTLQGFASVEEKLAKLLKFEVLSLKGEYPFLRDYQEVGVSWLLHLFENEISGLLADEMGLGKTVQAIILVDFLIKKQKIKQALVVAPTSVVYNWSRECAKFCPGLSVLVYHGPKRRECLRLFEDYDLVITSYPIVRLDSHVFKDRRFDILFLDEAQLIKNADSLTSRVVREISSRVRFALTGTPVENRASELWSIFDFLLPKGLGSKSLFTRLVEKASNQQVIDKLGQTLKPFILRREKAETLKSLPPKIETVELCEMTELQRQFYEAYKEYAFSAISDYKAGKSAYTHVFTAIMRLRQICNHPNSLIDSEEARAAGSGKLNRMCEIVDELIKNGRKVVIFCQFLEMIKIISDALNVLGIKTYVFTGSTKDRLGLIDTFASDTKSSCLVMSLKAGGLGLNLTMASDVILYDPWWNPQVENQAIDRLHRIGQKQTVFVYRLVTVDSIESRMEEIKETKRDLFSRLLSAKQVKLDINLLASLI